MKKQGPAPSAKGVSHRLSPRMIIFLYAVIGGLWIVTSDRLVDMISSNPETISHLQTYKGWFYVALTALMLHELIRLYGKRLMQAMSTLRASEERNRLLVESITDYEIFTLDLNGTITTWNLSAQSSKGYKREEIIGKPLALFYTNTDVDRGVPDKDLRRAAEKGKNKSEGWRVHKDGSLFWAEVVVNAMRDEQGILRGFSMVLHDITDRRLAEDRIRQLNNDLEQRNRELDAERARWKGVVEGIADEVWICDAEGRMSLINLPAETAMGLDPFSDKTVHQVLEEIEILNPAGDLRKPEDAPLLRSLKGQIVRGEEIVRHRDTGRQRYRQFSSAPVRDVSGSIAGAVAIVRDITEIKRTEEALRKSQTLLAEAEKLSHTGAWEWNVLTNVWTFSDEWLKIHGARRRSLSRDEVILIAFPDDRPVIEEAFENVRNGLRPYQLEHRIIRQDNGDIRVVRAYGQYVKDLTGKIISVYGFSQDVTEQKRAEEERERLLSELKRSNTELEQFAYVASHDLQEPLRMVQSYTTLLEKKYKERLDKKAHEYINFAADGAQRMQKLIEGLLSYSRITRKGALFKQVDLNSVFSLAISNLTVTIRETGAEITRDDLPTVSGDEMQLVQLFQNLLVNGVKYCKPNLAPQVHVTVRKDGRDYVISVSDNGIGIESQFFERIFQIFQRLHTRREYSGTGIGLALCKRIVERHSGRIWVESVPGEGSTFSFTIPVA